MNVAWMCQQCIDEEIDHAHVSGLYVCFSWLPILYLILYSYDEAH